MGKEFDKPVPSEGDTVKVTNTETNKTVGVGEVQKVQMYGPDHEYGDDEDNAVYMEFLIEEDNKLMFKWGYWDGEEYSWARSTNYGGPEVDHGENCFDYEIV